MIQVKKRGLNEEETDLPSMTRGRTEDSVRRLLLDFKEEEVKKVVG